MSSRLIPGVIAALCALTLSGCSEDKKQCPQCGAGTTCNQATGQCVPVSSAGCPTGGCGANATCRQDDVCVCATGFTDCNGDLGGTGGDGCECQGSCKGTACGGAGSCTPGTPNDCGQSGSYCSGGVCTPCPTGKFNCDGMNDCESSQACGTAGCSPATAGACGKNQYCNGTMCATCPEGKYNRRAMGPICDTSDLAGTGFSFCICTSPEDCANSTTGRLCKAAAGVPNPKLKQCTCDTGADCPPEYPICEGSVFKLCRMRCTDSSYCNRYGVQGYCDTSTGECSYPEI